MDKKPIFYYADNVNLQTEQLDFEMIHILEEKCRKQRSEAMYQGFASLVTKFTKLPATVIRWADLKRESTTATNAAVSLTCRRLNLHTE